MASSPEGAKVLDAYKQATATGAVAGHGRGHGAGAGHGAGDGQRQAGCLFVLPLSCCSGVDRCGQKYQARMDIRLATGDARERLEASGA